VEHKIFKNIEEQIALLSNDKGLIIDDVEYAKNCLSELNYYRLSGYSLTLRKNDHFYKDSKFSDIMQIYNFDREIKILLLGYLENVEISLRTHIAYELGQQDNVSSGTISYMKKDNYISNCHYNRFMETITREISNNRDEAFVKHHQRKYDGVLPIWAMVETLSFGKSSMLFASLNNDLKKQICDKYYYGIRYTVIENFLEGLVVLRNICAHHSRLYNRGLPHKPNFSNWEISYFEKQSYERESIGNKLFFRLLVLIRLSPDRLGISNTIINDICNLKEKYPFVDLKHYGFTKNWKNIIDHLVYEYENNK
jgi:abortive infection bacteriophage resistance protein